MNLLSYVPLVEPIELVMPHLSDYWLLLALPLLVAISIVYRATKVTDLRRLPHEAAKLVAQIVVIMILAAVALNLIYYVIAVRLG